MVAESWAGLAAARRSPRVIVAPFGWSRTSFVALVETDQMTVFLEQEKDQILTDSRVIRSDNQFVEITCKTKMTIYI